MRFAQSAQVFELSPLYVVFYIFVHMYPCVEHFRKVGGGKMLCRIIVLIGNDYSNDKKYSVSMVLGDYVEKGSV